jgi:DNA-binding beta-propeller fold protein YncE
MMNIGWRSISLLVVWAAVSGGLMVTGAPANAGTFGFESSFGTPGSNDGEFDEPGEAAVQFSTGDVFVADSSNGRVQVFGPEGQYLTQITGAEVSVDGGTFSDSVSGVAVDNSSGASAGDVYIVDGGHKVIDKFAPVGVEPKDGYQFVCQLTGIGGGCTSNGGTPSEPFATPTGVAVDASGDVYVAQFGGPVEEFDSAGNDMATLNASKITSGWDVAVNAAGSTVYVANILENVVKLSVDPMSHKIETEEILDPRQATAVAVDQTNGEVFVDDFQGGSHISVFDEASREGEAPIEEFGAKGEIGEFSFGIAYSTYDNEKVYVTDITNSDVHIYGQESEIPEIKCTKPREVKGKSVKLACTINPEGEEAKWYVEYKPEGGGAFTSTPEETALTMEEVEPTLANLTLSTKYVYRVVARNAHGLGESVQSAFTTLEAVPGEKICRASGVNGEGATLEALVDPSEPSVVQFEYGTSTSYGSATEERVVSPSESKATEIIGGLEPNTTYYCRFVARDAEGASAGSNETFHTTLIRPKVNDAPPVVSRLTGKTALLAATINPEKSKTTYYFAYVDEAGYEPAAEDPYHNGKNTPAISAGAGLGDETVGPIRISGLLPNTTYHYAILASNEGGMTIGPDHTFTTTFPTPAVGPATTTEVTPTSAIVSDTVDPEGLLTVYEFEIGTSITYNGAVMFGQITIGYETITVGLNDLAPGTTYHFRVVATNEEGTTDGLDQTLTTPGVPSPITQPLAPPLLTTPAIAFPTAQGKVITPPSKKKKTKPKKHHAKPKRKKK